MAVGSAFQAVGDIFGGIQAGKQATYAAKVADYNANVDIANAKQQAMNSVANIQSERLKGEAYQSSQRAAYAASGVLSDSGSAMAVQATTAARMEQGIQQYWNEAQQRESTQYAGAQMEVLKGKQQAQAYHMQAIGDYFKAAGDIANAIQGMPSSGSVSTAGVPDSSSSYSDMETMTRY
jgi:hypothetical protein